MKFTFFNVENADEVVANTARPRVTEKGAFAYREVGMSSEWRDLVTICTSYLPLSSSGEKEGACPNTFGRDQLRKVGEETSFTNL